MAKIKGPLLSLDAHGSINKILTYSNRRSGQQVRLFNKPLALPSGSQFGQRRLATAIIAQWQAMSAGTRASWETLAKASKQNLPGYHYFLRTALLNPYVHHGLVGYWSCNKIVNNQVLDISGRGNHGTLEPTPPSDIPKLITSRRRKFGNGLLYDGTNDYVDFGDRPDYDLSTAFTISLLTKTTLVATNRTILAKYHTTNRREWNLTMTSPSARKAKIAVGFGDPNNGTFEGQRGTTNRVMIQDKWQLIDAVYDAGTLNIYVDGIDIPLTTISGSVPSSLYNSTEPMKSGWTGGAGGYFKGIIDEIYLYNRALSPAEIAARWVFAR